MRTQQISHMVRGAILAACLLMAPWAMASVSVPLADVSVTGTATLIDPSNGDRLTLSCTNGSSSEHVRWGNTAVTATTGQRLPADRSIEIVSTGPIYMISEGAAATVSCTKELK